MAMHDAFISYATEDNDLAAEIAHGLVSNGLSVWYAPLSLKVGDKLLDSIESGLTSSRSGILILSPKYLEKKWTSYEMDILLRQHIEADKQLLPVWHNVDKTQVESRHVGLGGLVAVTDTTSIRKVVMKLIEPLSDGAVSRGVIPGWESPSHRFLSGLGEVYLNNEDGPAMSIFELLLSRGGSHFPFWLAGRMYAKEELLLHVAQLLGPVPDRAERWVGKSGYHQLWDMCKEAGLDPGRFY